MPSRCRPGCGSLSGPSDARTRSPCSVARGVADGPSSSTPRSATLSSPGTRSSARIRSAGSAVAADAPPSRARGARSRKSAIRSTASSDSSMGSRGPRPAPPRTRSSAASSDTCRTTSDGCSRRSTITRRPTCRFRTSTLPSTRASSRSTAYGARRSSSRRATGSGSSLRRSPTISPCPRIRSRSSRCPPESAYERLRSRTPSTFGAYLDAGDHRILSASPERFLRVRGRDVETRPIKGTRPRGRTPSEDRALADELRGSEKDAAENVMIVDLERNDLGKVCDFGSVHVPMLRGLRSLPNVHHLESVVSGRLRPDVSIPDLIRATFPGGSITGAPKPRAMEIIECLEPHRRGVYTGALGYVSWDRSLDWNIAIRTATVIGPTAYFAVGGGIVADSDPEAEYQEALDKLRGHAEALTQDRVEVTPDGLRVA